jgi:hypothetical protein
MFTDDLQAYDDAGGFSGANGKTPLIELRELSRELGYYFGLSQV